MRSVGCLTSQRRSDDFCEDEFIYYIMIRWSIINSDINTATPGIQEYTGLYDSDDFGQLIYAVLDQVSSNYPVGRVKYEIEKENTFPQFPGYQWCKIRFNPSISGSIEY